MCNMVFILLSVFVATLCTRTNGRPCLTGFFFDGAVPSQDYDGLQKCMSQYSRINQQQLSNCMNKTDVASPDLCQITLTAFNCNLDLIVKTCPSMVDFYSIHNYYIVKTCNASYNYPGSSTYPPVVVSGARMSMSLSHMGLLTTVFIVGKMLLE